MSVLKSKVVLNLDKKQGLLSKHGARIVKSGRQQTAVAEAASSKRGLVLRLSSKCWGTFLMWGGSFLAACWPLTVQEGRGLSSNPDSRAGLLLVCAYVSFFVGYRQPRRGGYIAPGLSI